jgi:hypothetical protein
MGLRPRQASPTCAVAQSDHAVSTPAPPRHGRLLELAWAGGFATVLLIARLITPDPRGYGTHTRLVPVPCLWHFLTGLPCPSCGLTTAFAWMARGRWREAWCANWLGPPAYLATWALLVWALLAALLGLPGPAKLLQRPRLLCAAAIVMLLVWAVRLVFLVRNAW